MKFINTPVSFRESEPAVRISRSIDERISMLDNLVELIVFTPKGSFEADPDFGFEYWNHEFSNINYREFNNDYYSISSEGICNDITKRECQESIRLSLATYAPQLKNVNISLEMDLVGTNRQENKKVFSKYMITVTVNADIDYGLGTTVEYNKDVKFLIEPTAKKYKI